MARRKAGAVHPDELPTEPLPRFSRACADCAAVILDGERCRPCAEVRRLLPRFVRLTAGRAFVERLLAELGDAG